EAESTFKDICGIINTLFAKNAVIVEKSKYSHALILDNIDEKAKQTAEKLQSVIMYPDGTASNVYISEDDIFFPHSDEYSDRGITTYRGNNYRDSGFFGNISIKEQKLEEIWSYEIGGMTGAGSIWPGVGWTGQPCIVKWDREMLSIMNVYEKFKNMNELIEVIYATLDGNIYFLDLYTGEPTRNYIYIGVPVKGTLSVDPRGYPLLYVGQGLEAATTNEGEDRYRPFGYRIFSLIDNKLLHEIKGYDTFAPRPGWGAFDSSGILDIKNDTYYQCGENGIIYIVKLNTVFDKGAKTISIKPEITRYKYVSEGAYSYGIESSPSIYEKYMYFTDNAGMLICLDLESLKILWAYNTGDDTDASVAIDVTEEGVFLYTANEVDIRGRDDNSNIRKFNALTGELLWQVDVPAFYVDVVNGGALASPVIGKGPIKDLVIFNISKTLEDSIWAGRLIAIDKLTGQIVWIYKSPYSWSSPVAVYTEDNKAYIAYCEHNGKISLLDALTGKQIDQITLSLGRQYITIEATPAIYDDILVVGTYAEKIYGVRIK
ncbi:MAG TPA: PQQ-binding-like beta-propeller repeat protein, partial [Clostridia bacterium]|nr:PQQ-binding-like beta-propeller repeat protein [Clostridia bacterium]